MGAWAHGRAENDTMGGTRPKAMTGMHTDSAYTLDLRDVRGQMGARRALEIAAAGELGEHPRQVDVGPNSVRLPRKTRQPCGDRPRSTAEYAERDKATKRRGRGALGRREDSETESEAAT